MRRELEERPQARLEILNVGCMLAGQHGPHACSTNPISVPCALSGSTVISSGAPTLGWGAPVRSVRQVVPLATVPRPSLRSTSERKQMRVPLSSCRSRSNGGEGKKEGRREGKPQQQHDANRRSCCVQVAVEDDDLLRSYEEFLKASVRLLIVLWSPRGEVARTRIFLRHRDGETDDGAHRLEIPSESSVEENPQAAAACAAHLLVLFACARSRRGGHDDQVAAADDENRAGGGVSSGRGRVHVCRRGPFLRRSRGRGGRW